MRIVHILFSLNVGGAEIISIDIINEQVKTEQVALIIINDKLDNNLLDKIDHRVSLILLNRREKSRNLLPLIKLNRYLIIDNPCIVHCHNEATIQMLLIRRNVVLTAHSMMIPIKNLKYFRKIFAISNAVKLDIEQRSPLKPFLIYNGINVNQISKKQNYDFETFHIVQVSRLEHSIKGQHLLLEALRILIHEKGIRNLKADFIGEGNSLEYLNELGWKYNINNYVNFLGMVNRNQIYKSLCIYNLLVQPSIYEGFGLTIVEAMAAKVPVLVSDIDGPMEVIGNGKWGFYFKSGDPFSLATKISEIMKCDKNVISQNSEEILKHVIDNFDVKSTASNYLANYQLL